MKKSLIALAALAATGAFAQSTVTLYGLADIAYGAHKTTSRDGTAFTKTGGVMDGSHAGSRIGFRGTEDLGGGLKASFVIEQGISPTQPEAFNIRVGSNAHQIAGNNTHTTGNSRQTFLGLAGGFGEVRIGYQYTNSYALVAFNGANPTEFQGGNYQNSFHANGGRANMITYMAPEFVKGLALTAQIGQGGGRGTVESNAAAGGNGFTKNNNAYTSLSALYKAGPLTAGMVYSKADVTQSNAIGATVTNAFGVVGTAATAAIANAATREQKGTHIIASYNLGMARVAATIVDGSNGGTSSVTAATKTKAQQFAVYVPFGAAEAFVSTGARTDKVSGAATNAVDSKGNTFGVRYNLSKRTVVYAFSGTDKDNGKTTAAAAGYKDTKTAVGVSHSF